MRKLLLLSFCAALFGCASTGSLKNIADVSPTAMLSVMSNNDITWHGEKQESHGLLGNFLEKKVDEVTGENALDLLPLAETTLRAALKKSGFEVLEAAAVINSDAYKKAKEDALAKNSGLIVPEGYRYIPMKNKDIVSSLSAGTGVKSGIHVNFNFQKMMSTGVAKNGIAKACVSMNFFVVNPDGKTIFQKSYFASSQETFAIVASVYNPKSLMALFPDAITQVCEKLALDLSK